MPKLPDPWGARRTARSASGIAQQGAIDTSGAQALAQTAVNIGRGMKDREDRFAYAKAEGDFLSKQTDILRNLDDDDFDTYSDRYDQAVELALEESKKGLSSREAERFGLEMSLQMQRGRNVAIGKADDKRKDFNRAETKSAVDQGLIDFLDAPDEMKGQILRTVHNRIASAREDGYYTQQEAEAWRNSIDQSWSIAHAETLAPQARVEYLKREESIPGHKKVALRRRAEAEIKQAQKALQSELRADLSLRVEDSVAALTQGLAAPDAPTREEFRGAYGREKGDQRYARFRNYQRLGNDLAQVPGLEPDQVMSLLEKRRPVPGEGFAEQTKAFNLLTQHIIELEKAKQDDPVRFLSRHSKVDLEDPEALLEEQRRLGVRKPKLLSNEQANEIVERFEFNEDGGSNAAELVESLAGEYGERWPDLYKQLSGKIPQAAQVIGMGVEKPVAATLARIAGVSTADLKSGLDSFEANGAKRQVTGALMDVQKTLSYQAGGPETFGVIRDEAERLAYYYMAQGKGANEAAEKAADEIIMSKYSFAETYRVPTPIDADTIEEGAGQVLSALTLEDLDIARIPGVSESFNQERFERLKEEAYWVTSPDEDGLVLYHMDSAVPGKNGPVQFTWDQLAENVDPSWWERLFTPQATRSNTVVGMMPQRGQDGQIAP